MRVIQKALTFDDVLLVPAHSTVLPAMPAETRQRHLALWHKAISRAARWEDATP